MRYLVTIAGRTVEVDLSGTQPVVDGEPVEAHLSSVAGTKLRHLLVGRDSHGLLAERVGAAGIWGLRVGGRSLSAEVVDERTRTIREMAGGAEVEADRRVTAPMPGLVVRLLVEMGQRVEAGQGVVVVEAMKMENELKAPAGGVVTRVEVQPGQPVEKGAVLVVLE